MPVRYYSRSSSKLAVNTTHNQEQKLHTILLMQAQNYKFEKIKFIGLPSVQIELQKPSGPPYALGPCAESLLSLLVSDVFIFEDRVGVTITPWSNCPGLGVGCRAHKLPLSCVDEPSLFSPLRILWLGSIFPGSNTKLAKLCQI